MREPAALARRRLVIAVLVGLTLVLLAAIPLPDWLQAAVFVPLVLLVPGWAASRLIVPGAGAAETAVYAFALSVGAAALGGLVLQFFVDLDRTVWAALATTIAVVAVITGLGRRRPAAAPRRRRARVNPLAVAGFAGAVALAGGAIAIASDGVEDQRAAEHFTALWAAPAEPGDPQGDWSVSVLNHEGEAVSYLLRVTGGAEVIEETAIELEPGGRSEALVSAASLASSDEPAVASLYRQGRLFRQVAVNAAAGP
jgi:hypothetical protein